jgi:hypothetical protein
MRTEAEAISALYHRLSWWASFRLAVASAAAAGGRPGLSIFRPSNTPLPKGNPREKEKRGVVQRPAQAGGCIGVSCQGLENKWIVVARLLWPQVARRGISNIIF